MLWPGLNRIKPKPPKKKRGTRMMQLIEKEVDPVSQLEFLQMECCDNIDKIAKEPGTQFSEEFLRKLKIGAMVSLDYLNDQGRLN